MLKLNASWQPVLDWNTPAGRVLEQLIQALPSNWKPVITLFESAPLQMGVDGDLSSADVDVFCNEDLKAIVEKNHLGRDQSPVYIQVCDELNFRTSPKWLARAYIFSRDRCTLRFPHPIDILIAKMHRVDPKDLRAFEVVIEKTGHPTEAELISELQDAVDLFRPGFDEEKGSDMITTTRILWRHIFKRDINPRKEIVAPALEHRRKGYGEPSVDLKNELREVAKMPAKAKRRVSR